MTIMRQHCDPGYNYSVDYFIYQPSQAAVSTSSSMVSTSSSVVKAAVTASPAAFRSGSEKFGVPPAAIAGGSIGGAVLLLLGLLLCFLRSRSRRKGERGAQKSYESMLGTSYASCPLLIQLLFSDVFGEPALLRAASLPRRPGLDVEAQPTRDHSPPSPSDVTYNGSPIASSAVLPVPALRNKPVVLRHSMLSGPPSPGQSTVDASALVSQSRKPSAIDSAPGFSLAYDGVAPPAYESDVATETTAVSPAKANIGASSRMRPPVPRLEKPTHPARVMNPPNGEHYNEDTKIAEPVSALTNPFSDVDGSSNDLTMVSANNPAPPQDGVRYTIPLSLRPGQQALPGSRTIPQKSSLG
jgi:hypothetical protein